MLDDEDLRAFFFSDNKIAATGIDHCWMQNVFAFFPKDVIAIFGIYMIQAVHYNYQDHLIKYISSVCKQLDDIFGCLNGLKNENECIRALCEQSLETISTKLNDQQLDRVFSAFIHGLKDEDKNIRESCAKSLDGDNDVRKSCAESLGVIAEKLNEKQLENAINTLIDGLKDKDEYIRRSFEGSLGVISMNLTDKQLEGVFNALPNEEKNYYFDSYRK
ncbi:hypothetical protein RFI_38346, partial [Reticulomyxa filosa]